MYPGEMVWDNQAEGGPAQVHVGNAREAIARDPKRYSLERRDAPAAAKPVDPPKVSAGGDE